ncbi:hypothetical protein HYS93_03460 [Candidatus Daviesbacteria bacterium]|nr:hypothetical protein [Candidatus Daviesbacteria bacterium]
MPKFFKENLLSNANLDPARELKSPLDNPELPLGSDDNLAKRFMEEELDPVKTLLEWEAASRPFRKKDRSYYTTIAVLVVLISLIALLWGEKMLIGAILAFAFLVYVLNFIPPQNVKYKISTQGVTISDQFYHWQLLDSFWFSEKDGFKILHILTRISYPGVLMLVLGNLSEQDIRRVCARFLPYHEIAPKSLIDKWSESLQKHFPLENPHS